MNRLLFFTLFLLSELTLKSQSPVLKYGVPRKTENQIYAPHIIYTDSNYIYYYEKQHRGAIVILPVGFKPDILFMNRYNKRTLAVDATWKFTDVPEDYNFLNAIVVNDNIYVFYISTKDLKSLDIHAAIVDKKSLQSSKFTTVASFTYEEKFKYSVPEIVLSGNLDKSGICLTSIIDKDNQTAQIHTVDLNLNKTGTTIIRFPEHTIPSTIYSLWCKKPGQYLAFRTHVESQGDKKKKLSIQYVAIEEYNEKGVKTLVSKAENGNNTFINAGPLWSQKGKLFIYGSYADIKDKSKILGMGYIRFDPTTGKQEMSSFVPDSEIKSEVFKKNENKTFFALNTPRILEDEETMVLSGEFHLTSRMTTPGMERSKTAYGRVDLSKHYSDLFIACIGPNGKFYWNASIARDYYLPVSNYAGNGPILFHEDDPAAMMDLFGSFYTRIDHQKFYLLFNDHEKNIGITTSTKKPARLKGIDNIQGFLVSIDLKTGAVKRESIGNSSLVPLARRTFLSGAELIIPFVKPSTIDARKMEIALGRIQF